MSNEHVKIKVGTTVPIAVKAANSQPVSVDLGTTKVVSSNDYDRLINKPSINDQELIGNTTISMDVKANSGQLLFLQNQLTISSVKGDDILTLGVGETSTIREYIDNKIQTTQNAEEINANTKTGDYIFIATEE